MKEILKNVVPLLLLIGGAGGAYALVAMRQDPPRTDRPTLAPMVELELVSQHTGDLKLRVDGVATPFREIVLSAEVGGRVTFKSESCRAGRFVAAGEKLLEIDPRDYELEGERLTKELEQAQAARNELEVQITNSRDLLANGQEELQLQRNEYEREQKLGAATATTRSQIEAAQRAVITVQNRVIELNNQIRLFEQQRSRLDSTIELAQAKLSSAQLSIERTVIISPVNGVVVEDTIEQGSLAQLGTKLVTIEDTSAIEVKCNLQSEELYWIWSQAKEFQPKNRYELPPLPAIVTYEAGGRSYRWQGRLNRYDGIGFDQRTRMVPCRVIVANPFDVMREKNMAFGAVGESSSQPNAADAGSNPRDRAVVPALMRGMFVSVELAVEPQGNLLNVNQRAIQPTGEVIVVKLTGEKSAEGEATGLARMVEVKVLHYDGERAIIAPVDESIAAGELVTVTPLTGASPYELREGSVKVRIAPENLNEGVQ